MNAWEERKLKTLASFSKGKGYTKNDLLEDGHKIILYGSLYTKYQTIISNVDTYADLKESSILSSGIEVIIPSSGETSEDIARASAIEEQGVILGGDLNIITPMNSLNSIFLALTISNGEQKKELMKRAQGNSVVHLYNSDLKVITIFYPSIEEQAKIGHFFKQLDKTITLQEQALSKLQQLKQSLLQKMFVN